MGRYSRYNKPRLIPGTMVDSRSIDDDENGEYDIPTIGQLSALELQIESDNAMLLAYGLPIVDGAELWNSFSVGGCHRDIIGPPKPKENRPNIYLGPDCRGLEWGESYWGDKRNRKRTKVRRRAKRELTAEQRAKLVAYRANLVATMGRAFETAIGDDCESMLAVEKNCLTILHDLS